MEKINTWMKLLLLFLFSALDVGFKNIFFFSNLKCTKRSYKLKKEILVLTILMVVLEFITFSSLGPELETILDAKSKVPKLWTLGRKKAWGLRVPSSETSPCCQTWSTKVLFPRSLRLAKMIMLPFIYIPATL